jgi:predicted secreted protein
MCITILSISSSCAVASIEYHIEISCAQFENVNNYRSEIVMEVGDKIILELCSNQSTGFKWEYEITTENIVNEIDYEFQEPEADVVGAAGVEKWTFEVIAKGTTEIKMEYSQPWEGGTKAVWTYGLVVTVE